jgi:lysozyme
MNQGAKMANESMRTSAAGTAALRLRENVVPNYYNDSANNCTFGVGTLAHLGPCTAEELTRTVTTAMIDGQLAGGLRDAESTVRLHVRRDVDTGPVRRARVVHLQFRGHRRAPGSGRG